MSSRQFVLLALNGVSFGALLFLLSSGFTLIFGLMRIVNLAHGSFYLIGGYVGLTLIQAGQSFWVAMIGGALAIAVLGFVVERGLLRRVRGRTMPEVLLTVGLSLIFADLALAQFGGDPILLPRPPLFAGTIEFGEVTYPTFRLFVLGLGIVIAALMWLLQSKTRIGAIIRAGVDDREMVAALGINVNAIFTGVFVFGALLAGMTGVIGGVFLSLYPGADAEILNFALVVVILGGLGDLRGAIIGSLLVGLIDAFGRSLTPSLSYFLLFAPMALILIFKPQGLLGRVTESR
ncbi:MAG: branched-chain amino acid ABC transporter permease [Actinobacteria bacterium]|nr:branched-chain amino acid ABC transporter permease [Actinomycetota bacterium]